MPSEYDFLLPYSGPLRRAGTLMVAGGAFVGGMICAGLVVAFTMQTPDDGKGVTAAAVQPPSPAPGVVLRGPTQANAAPVDTAPAATPRAAAHQDEAKPSARPPAEPRQTVGLSNPKPAEPAPAASTASTEPSAAEIPLPEPRPEVATTEPEAKPERPRKRVKRVRTLKSHAKRERARGNDRDGVREFVDQYGVRHVILPRRWNGDDGRAMARERPYDRRSGVIFERAPGGFFQRY